MQSFVTHSTIPHTHVNKITANHIDLTNINSLKDLYGTVTMGKTGPVVFNLLDYTLMAQPRKWYQIKGLYHIPLVLNPGQISAETIREFIDLAHEYLLEEESEMLLIIHTLTQLQDNIQTLINSNSQNILSAAEYQLTEYANIAKSEILNKKAYEAEHIDIYASSLFDFLKDCHPLLRIHLNNPKFNQIFTEELQMEYRQINQSAELMRDINDSEIKELRKKIQNLLEE